MSRVLSSLSRQIRQNVRPFSRGEVRMAADPEVVKKIKAKQQKFQAMSDTPVFLRSGKLHFYVTAAIGVVSFLGVTYNAYRFICR